MIDFSKYKENLTADAFISIVSKDIIKELDAGTKEKIKADSSYFDIHFSFALQIRNKYIYPYLEKHRFAGERSIHEDDLSHMIASKVIKKLGGTYNHRCILDCIFQRNNIE